MVRTVVWMALIASTAMQGYADEVEVDGLPYTGSTVRRVSDGVLVFDLNRRRFTKPLADVTLIRLDGQAAYNAAEALLEQQQYAQAAAAFGELAGRGNSDLVEQLIPWRQMYAYSQAGHPDQALRIWSNLLNTSQAAGIVEAMPTGWAEAGSEANDRAIERLEELRGQYEDSEDLWPTLRDALVELYRLQGRTNEALSLLEQVAATAPAAGDGPVPGGADVSPLQLAQLRLENNQPGEALAMITETLRQLPGESLAEALLISGKARLSLAGPMDPAEARPGLIEAGLDLMLVVVNFPRSPQAPEALLLAGDVCRRLGNADAAASAWNAVLTQYRQTPWAAQAQEKLNALPNRAR